MAKMTNRTIYKGNGSRLETNIRSEFSPEPLQFIFTKITYVCIFFFSVQAKDFFAKFLIIILFYLLRQHQNYPYGHI